MRAIRLLPLMFLIGIDGFAMFAPYLIGLLAAAYLFSRLRQQPQPHAVPVSS